MRGDADIANIGALVADPGRARILLALGDGRRCPRASWRSRPAWPPSTTSAHLGKLVKGGLLLSSATAATATCHGRPRGGRFDGGAGQAGSAAPVRSLARGTGRRPAGRAHLLRRSGWNARHALMAAMFERDLLTGGDGFPPPTRPTPTGCPRPALTRLPADLARVAELRASASTSLAARARPRPLIRYCVDWSEQRDHLAGALGAALTTRLFELGWVGRRVKRHPRRPRQRPGTRTACARRSGLG